MSKITLYSYYQSSASYRVRIALYHKNITFNYAPVSLVAGAQHEASYLRMNPMKQVPAIVTEGGSVIAQSMAIFLWLDQIYENIPLFPNSPESFASVVQFCENINSGIHPLQNLSVRKELGKRYSESEEGQAKWCAFWIRSGFEGIEKCLKDTAGKFCFGDTLTAADMFLIPQVANAKRYKVDLAQFPKITQIDSNCSGLEAFKKAHPSVQPDTPKT